MNSFPRAETSPTYYKAQSEYWSVNLYSSGFEIPMIWRLRIINYIIKYCILCSVRWYYGIWQHGITCRLVSWDCKFIIYIYAVSCSNASRHINSIHIYLDRGEIVVYNRWKLYRMWSQVTTGCKVFMSGKRINVFWRGAARQHWQQSIANSKISLRNVTTVTTCTGN